MVMADGKNFDFFATAKPLLPSFSVLAFFAFFTAGRPDLFVG
jgi:hypothetical protein